MTCEQGAPWPRQLAIGLTSCIPKPGPTDDLSTLPTGKLGTIRYANAPYDQPLTPIWTAYTSIRFRQMASWREQILPSEMYGARSSREAVAAFLDFTLQLEQAHGDHSLLIA